MLPWIAAIVLAFGLLHMCSEAGHTPPPPRGQIAASEPLQEAVDDAPVMAYGDYRLRQLADFDIRARVLGRSRYRWDEVADLSPVDLVLGWGPMSDSDVLAEISITQSGRFYYWHVDRFPIPRADIERHSANMHMIPATDAIADQLDSVRPDELIHIRGRLVEATRGDGLIWRSSLTRNDVGAGACELVWVEQLERP